MVDVWLSCLHRWTISLALDAQGVRLYSCVLDFEAVVLVWLTARSQSPLHFLAKYNTIMAMIGVRLFLSNQSDVNFAHGRTGRTSVFVCVRLWCCSSGLILRGHNLTPIPCHNILQWRWSVFDYLGCIDERFRWLWTNSEYVVTRVLDFEGFIRVRSSVKS